MPAEVPIRGNSTRRFVAAIGSRFGIVGRVSATVSTGPFLKEATFYILPNLSCSARLGVDSTDKYGVVLKYSRNRFTFLEPANVKISFVWSSGSREATYGKQRSFQGAAQLWRTFLLLCKNCQWRKTCRRDGIEGSAAFAVGSTFHQKRCMVSSRIIEVKNLADRVIELRPDYRVANCAPVDEKLIQPQHLVVKRLMQSLVGPAKVAGPPKFVKCVQVGELTPLAPDLGKAERLLGEEAAAAIRKLCLEYCDFFSNRSKGVTTLLKAA